MLPRRLAVSPVVFRRVAFAAAAPLFVLLYYTDQEFRTTVDSALRRAQEHLYRIRLERWYERVWEPLEGWQQESTKGFVLRMFRGNHFFLNERRTEVLSAVLQDLASVIR